MDSRNGPARKHRVTIRLPEPLYQIVLLASDRRQVDAGATIRYLIETHPDIAFIMRDLYDGHRQEPSC